ncbi:MAG: Gfo/Idh/MocA family oxidoreductase, partial [Oligoflexia bacterium]|nr:Gfo/Idh/MocA family oxidoreductase [Oligoflexia bacterium]
MKKIRIALVGCGRISQKHFEALARLENYFELVAICDIDSSRLDWFNKTFSSSSPLPTPSPSLLADTARLSPKYYNCYDKMLEAEAENIDLVSICTPSGIHP